MYSREIDSKVLTLAASGWTYNNTFVLYDKETESLWYPFGALTGRADRLTCISGFYADRFLPELPATRARWNEWIIQKPNSKYLKCSRGLC